MVCVSTDASSRGINAPNSQKASKTPVEKLLIEIGVPQWLLAGNGQILLKADEVILDDKVFHQVDLPVSFSETRISLKDASFETLEGQVELDFDLNRATQTFSSRMQLNEIIFATEKSPPKPEKDQAIEFIFDDSPLLPQWTQDLRGSLELTAINSKIDDFTAHHLETQANFDSTSVRATITGSTDSGQINGKFRHTYDSKKTDIDVQGHFVPLTLLPAVRGYVENIALDFDINIATYGISARQWVSAMDGEIIAEFDGGKINIEKFDKLSKDILSLTLSSLLPIPSGPAHSSFDCGAIVLSLTDGVALGQNSIALRTQNLAVIGGGEVDFAHEKLAVALIPHARNTGKLNTKTAIKKISITGPFQNLEVEPQLGGIINQGISLTTKIASFGLSKIGVPLLDWAAPAEVACMRSLHSAKP